MCGKCDFLHARRSIRRLVYSDDQPLNHQDEALIDSMMQMLQLRNPKFQTPLEGDTCSQPRAA